MDEAAAFLREVGSPPPGIMSFRNWARLARMRHLPSDIATRVDAAEQLLESAAAAARSAPVSGCRRIGGAMLCTLEGLSV